MKRICSFLLAAAIALGGCLLLAPTPALANKGDKHFKEGLQYEAAQDWERAVQEFTLAVAADPYNVEYQLHFRRASFNASRMSMQQVRALAEQRDYFGAYNAFRQAYAFDPTNEPAVSEMERTLRLHNVKEGTNSLANRDGARLVKLQDSGPQLATQAQALLPPSRTEGSQSAVQAQEAPLPPPRTEGSQSTVRAQEAPLPPPRTEGSQSTVRAQEAPLPPPRTEGSQSTVRAPQAPLPLPRPEGSTVRAPETQLPPSRTEGSRPAAQKAPLPPPRTEQNRVISPSADPPKGAKAQEGGVTLSGTAMDQAGALIPGEKLTLLNKKTGENRKTKSDDSGQFIFSNVLPGEYVLRGEADGFQPAELAIAVGTEQMKPIKLKMDIGISEDVTVSAKASEPELAENNADAVSFNINLLANLPTQNQDISSLLSNFLSPAAMDSGGPSIVVDGVESGDLSVPMDSIKSVSINKNPYSAEYRRPGLARIEVITRNGSRKTYEGSFAAYYRNGALSARNSFAVQKPELDMKLFAAHFSGPAPFKRATFFLSGNRLINDDTAVVKAITLAGPLTENVPTFKRSTNLLARIDIKPNKLNRITLNYNFADQPERNRGVGGLKLVEQGIDAGRRMHKFQVADTTAFSQSLVNTLRFTLDLRNQHVGIRAVEPAIHVKGAFTGGPSQTARSGQDTRFEFQDVAVYTHGIHTLTFGGAAGQKFSRFSDASDFGGTFTFSSLSAFAAKHPILFEIVEGQPDVSFSQLDGYGFVQDQIGLAKHLNLMLGLRYEWQSKLGDYNNFAPRVALAFAHDQKTVFRVGAGIFYDRLADTVIQRSLLLDGVHTSELVIKDPSYPDPFPGGVPPPTLPSVWRTAPDINTPYLFQVGAGVERKLGTGTQLTVDYQSLRGVHLFRARDINAPIGGIRPNPTFHFINQVESSASLRSNVLAVSLQGKFFSNLKGMLQYTLSRTTDDTNGLFGLPVDSRDLSSERGRSDLDKRHRFNFVGTYSLPSDFKLAAVLSLATGPPFDISTGVDNNKDSVVNDRPAGVTRNTGQSPGYAQLDLRLSKFFAVPAFRKELRPGSRSRNLALNLDVFNVLNHNNLSNVIGNISSPFFGRANSSLQPRTFQLSFKYGF